MSSARARSRERVAAATLAILLRVALTLLGMLTIAFAVFRSLPDPVEADDPLAGGARASVGVEGALPGAYGRFLVRALSFDWGVSRLDGRAVADVIAGRLLVSLQILVPALALAAVVAVLWGSAWALAARRRGWSRASGLALSALQSIPPFLVGALLLIGFCAGSSFLPLFPAGGLASREVDRGVAPFVVVVLDRLWHLVLPLVSLSLVLLPVATRRVHASLREFLAGERAEALRARGLSRRRLVLRHGLRYGAAPLVTVLAQSMAALLGGAILIETVFALPGIGSLTVESFFRRDYPVLLGLVITTGALTLLLWTAGDLIGVRLDPRLREAGPPFERWRRRGEA